MIRFFLLACVILATPTHACVPKEPVAPLPEVVEIPIVIHPVPTPRVVLITIDGTRWQDIYGDKGRELAPNLYRHFVDKGVAVGKTSEFIATGPAHISLPGYLEIMRGHPSYDCQSNECNPKVEPTAVDLFNESAVFASWDVIAKTYNKNKAYSDCVTRPDSETENLLDQYLQEHTPEFLWLSLGDTDEHAHAGDYNSYLQSIREADSYVGKLIDKYGTDNTIYIVTADHGRSKDWRHHGWDMESARDWVMITGRNVPAQGFLKLSKKTSLSNILPTINHLVFGVDESRSLL